MKPSSIDDKQLEEILEAESGSLPLALIRRFSYDLHLLKVYESKFPNNIYTNILLTLTHELFDNDHAKALWEGVIAHKTKLDALLHRDVGVLVAAADFLINMQPVLQQPKLIEQEKSDYVSRVSIIDELTGLHEREVFEVVLKKESDESRRAQRSLCVAMLDIDDFKQVNDQYGHIAGDEVLEKVGEEIHNSIREMDLAARYGGEEIVIVMPNTNSEQAYDIVERLRVAIAEMNFDKSHSVTVSAGIAAIGSAAGNADRLVELADQALYQSKESGKNRTTVYADV